MKKKEMEDIPAWWRARLVCIPHPCKSVGWRTMWGHGSGSQALNNGGVYDSVGSGVKVRATTQAAGTGKPVSFSPRYTRASVVVRQHEVGPQSGSNMGRKRPKMRKGVIIKIEPVVTCLSLALQCASPGTGTGLQRRRGVFTL